MEDHREYRLAAYLLDSLSAEGRREVEAHLAACARCREELVALQATLGLVKKAFPADAGAALDKARLVHVLGAWKRARVRRGWIVSVSAVAAAVLILGGLLFLAAGASVRYCKKPVRHVAELPVQDPSDDESVTAPGVAPAPLSPAEPMGVTVSDSGEPGGNRAAFGVSSFEPAHGTVALLRGNIDYDGAVAPAPEAPVVERAGEELMRADPARRALPGADGANYAIGIGGGAAGANGGRWADSARPESGVAVSGDEYKRTDDATVAAEGQERRVEILTADIPAGTQLDNLTNTQMAEEARGREQLRLAAEREAATPPTPSKPKAPARPAITTRKAAEKKSSAPSAKPETPAPADLFNRQSATGALVYRETGDKLERARDLRGEDDGAQVAQDPVTVVEKKAAGAEVRWGVTEDLLAETHMDLPDGFGVEDGRKFQNQPSATSAGIPQLGDAPQLGRASAHAGQEKGDHKEVTRLLANGLTAGESRAATPGIVVNDAGVDDIQGWSFGFAANARQDVNGTVRLDDSFRSHFDALDLGGDLSKSAGRGGGLSAAGEAPARAGGVPIGAEPLLRAYSYYRGHDANLDLASFRAHLLPVPPPSADAEGLSRDEFRTRYGVNPLVDTRIDHFSTFGMDVDTASYTRARDALRAGKLPEPKSVRVEEFVNYFPEEYPADPESAFSVFCEGGPSPFGRGFELLKIAVKARELRQQERKNAVLTFVVDVSGSMAAPACGQAAGAAAPTRLKLAAHALATLLDALGADDRVGIVAYSTHPTLILPHTPARERRRLLGAMESLAPSGATNIEAGLDLAYRVADEVFDAKALNRVILCSDGIANLGARGPEEILRKVTVFARRGIYLSAVGFGTGKYNDAMLVELSDKGNGNYRHVDSPEEAARIFYQDLPKTLDVLAQDAKIQVDFNPDVVSHYRLLGYEKRDIKDQDFRNDKVDAGEVGPGTTVTVLYEITRHTNPQGDIGKIFLRYRDVGTGRIEETNYPLRAGVLAVSLRDTTDRFRFIAAAAETAELLRESYFARDGSFEKVAALLARASPEFKARPEWVELNELVARAWRLALQRLGALAAAQ